MPAERLAKTCAVPDCDRKTLRTYCIRCEVNGQAAEHLRHLADEEAAADV